MFCYKEHRECSIEKFIFSTAEVNEAVAQPPPEEEEDQNEDQDVPDLTNFTIEELKQYVMFLNLLLMCMGLCIMCLCKSEGTCMLPVCAG